MRIEYPEEKQLPQLKALWKLAFGDEDDFIELFFSSAYSPDRCHVAMAGETVAAMLYWLDCEYKGRPYAYLYAVATHPDFRGCGLCRALMEDTHRELSRRGYAGAALYPAGAALRRMYGKLGYRDWGRAAELACKAGAPVPVREISREEYTVLRREYLPEDALIQEGEHGASGEDGKPVRRGRISPGGKCGRGDVNLRGAAGPGRGSPRHRGGPGLRTGHLPPGCGWYDAPAKPGCAPARIPGIGV